LRLERDAYSYEKQL
jgi:hypothetical protein